MEDPFDKFRHDNNYRMDTEARVCCNCAHYYEMYDDRSCTLARITTPDGSHFSDMWTEPNSTCNRFEKEVKP